MRVSINCQSCGHAILAVKTEWNNQKGYFYDMLMMSTSFENDIISCGYGSRFDGLSFIVNKDHPDAIGHMDDICDFCLYEMIEEGIILFDYDGDNWDEFVQCLEKESFICQHLNHKFQKIIKTGRNMYYIEYNSKYYEIYNWQNGPQIIICEYDAEIDDNLVKLVNEFFARYSEEVFQSLMK